MKLTLNSIILLLTLTLAACNGNNNTKEGEETKAAADDGLTAAEARAIAKEAYIYGYPLVDDYRIQHAYFVQKDNTEYKGAYNVLHSAARVYTPADKAVQTPNSDTQPARRVRQAPQSHDRISNPAYQQRRSTQPQTTQKSNCTGKRDAWLQI